MIAAVIQVPTPKEFSVFQKIFLLTYKKKLNHFGLLLEIALRTVSDTFQIIIKLNNINFNSKIFLFYVIIKYKDLFQVQVYHTLQPQIIGSWEHMYMVDWYIKLKVS